MGRIRPGMPVVVPILTACVAMLAAVPFVAAADRAGSESTVHDTAIPLERVVRTDGTNDRRGLAGGRMRTSADGTPRFEPMSGGPSGIIGWWRGEGNANDAVGANNGTPHNGATFAAGMVGQAFSLDGANDYVGDIGTTSTFSFIQNTGVFTIEAWIKLSDPNAIAEQAITANTPTTIEKGHYFIWDNSTGQQRLGLFLMKGVSGTPVINSASASQVITNSDWHHVAAVGNGTGITFYVDGTAKPGSGVMGSKPSGNSTRALDIGHCPPVSSQCPFNGRIDELAIYDRALSASEIQSIYNAGSAGRCALSIGDVTVTEGNAGTVNATFTVSLSNPNAATVTVDYATANGTATTANNDYVSASGQLTIPAKALSTTVTVVVNGDLVDEANETFFVNLSAPVNATLVDAQGMGTIANDDGAPPSGGVDLSWVGCVFTGGQSNQNFACAPGGGNTGYNLNVQFRLEGGIPNFLAATSHLIVYDQTSAPLSPFWHYESGGCNILSFSDNISSVPGCDPGQGGIASDPWDGFGEGGSESIEAFVPDMFGPGTGLFILRDSRSSSSFPLDEGINYYAYHLRFLNSRRATCAGCGDQVSILLDKMVIESEDFRPAILTEADKWTRCVTINGAPGNCPPLPQSIQPTQGVAGTTVMIFGRGFGATSNVSFNGTSALFTFHPAMSGNDTLIAIVPSGATTGPVQVQTAYGSASGPTFTVTTPVGVPQPEGASNASLSLVAYPSPARGAVAFAIRSNTGSGLPARVRIADVTGRAVRTINVGPLGSGVTNLGWDGSDDDGRAVPSGMYMLQLEVGGKRHDSARTMILR